jgi:membrane-associated protein
VGLTVTGYFAASIPQVRTVAYIIAGVVIALSIIFSVRAWILDRRDKLEKLAASDA